MSHAEYIPSFIPDRIDQDLIQGVREFNDQEGQPNDPALEESIAKDLATASHEYFDSVPYPADLSSLSQRQPSYFYTPERAQEEGIGNCFAHSTATAKIGTHPLLGLSVRSHWNGHHASNIWSTPQNVWQIDGETKKYTLLFDKTLDVTKFTFADLAYGGRFYYHLYPPFSTGITEELQFEEAPEHLGEQPTTFPQSRLVLPVQEAELVFKAIGDRRRYRDQGRHEEIAANAQYFDQIIPPCKAVPDIILPAGYMLRQGLKDLRTER